MLWGRPAQWYRPYSLTSGILMPEARISFSMHMEIPWAASHLNQGNTEDI